MYDKMNNWCFAGGGGGAMWRKCFDVNGVLQFWASDVALIVSGLFCKQILVLCNGAAAFRRPIVHNDFVCLFFFLSGLF